MSDLPGIDSWQRKFEEWRESSMPLFKEGKVKQAFAAYPFVTTEGEPFARLSRPASQTKFGMLTTGGYSIEGEQEAFVPLPSFEDAPVGVRSIPVDVDRSKLRIDHPGYHHRFAEEDINVNLPLDRMTELVERGEIGAFAGETQVIMGLQPNVTPLIRDFIPQLVETFRSQDVEAVLLVPS